MTVVTQCELDWTQFGFEGSHGNMARSGVNKVAQYLHIRFQDKKTKNTLLPIPTSHTTLPAPFQALIVLLVP